MASGFYKELIQLYKALHSDTVCKSQLYYLLGVQTRDTSRTLFWRAYNLNTAINLCNHSRNYAFQIIKKNNRYSTISFQNSYSIFHASLNEAVSNYNVSVKQLTEKHALINMLYNR